MNRIRRTMKLLFNTLGYAIAKKDREPSACPSLPIPSQQWTQMAGQYFANSFPIASHCGLTHEEIEQRLKEYFWHYPFKFGDLFVDADQLNFRGLDGRSYQRYFHIFAAILSMTQGTLKGKTVLDIGCNAGFWSVQARLAGADHVVGVDFSSKNIEQAKFILQITGLDGIEYRVVNAYDVGKALLGEFDITFFLGLLYHLDKPISAFERLYEVTKEFAVIDTALARSNIPANVPLLRVDEDIVHEQNVSNRIALVPSKSAVPLMLKHVGFREVFWIQNATRNLPLDYLTHARMTFVAVK